MTSQEMEAKCIALMKKLGVFYDQDKLMEWVRDYAVITDEDSDDLIVIKRSELKPDMEIGCVLCGVYDPFCPMREGSTVQPCHDCKIPIVVSHDSPTEPPKVCRDCAITRRNNQEGTVTE